MAQLERFSFLLLCVAQFTIAARFKVAVSPLEEDYTRRSVGDACSEYETVADPEDFLLPQGFEDLPRPWVDNPPATTGISATVTQGIDSLFRLKVPGLGGQRIADVIEELKREGCLSFPWGGSVRDQFLGALPADLDMESNCSPDKMQNISVKKSGVHQTVRDLVQTSFTLEILVSRNERLTYWMPPTGMTRFLVMEPVLNTQQTQ